MAGDYLPIRLDLPDDPAVIQMAAALDIGEDDVVGRLIRTWAWFNKHTENGHAKSVTKAWLDRYTSTPGWSDAMEAAGWLEISEEGLTVPKYDNWNSEAAKIRLKANERKRKQRVKEKGETDQSRDPSRDGHASGVTEVGPHNTTVQDSTKKTDHIRTSWKDKDYQLQVRQAAAENFRGVPFLEPHEYREEDRRDLLAIAAIHLSGEVKPAWLLTRIDAMRAAHERKPVTALVRYLKRALADYWPSDAEKRYGAFYKLLYTIGQEIPPEMLAAKRQPAEAAT
jgi:hypothetical protein